MSKNINSLEMKYTGQNHNRALSRTPALSTKQASQLLTWEVTPTAIKKTEKKMAECALRGSWPELDGRFHDGYKT